MKKTRKALKKYQDEKNRAKKKAKPIPEPIPSDIIEFVEQYRILKGKPYSLKGWEFLIPLYRNQSPQVNVAKGRQTGMTEFAMNWLIFHLLTNKGIRGLYVSDIQPHVLAFAERLREAIHSSKKLEPWLENESNERVKFVNGSILNMVTGWGKLEKTRSYPVDFCVVDEVQSIDLTGLPVLKETLAASPYKRLFLIGTGSDEGSLWHKEWMSGIPHDWDMDQKEWIKNQLPGSERQNNQRSQQPLPGIG